MMLATFGTQNRIFNSNPEETKFFKVFKRHTHFSQESFTIPLEGPNELTMDSAVRLRAKIPRYADLLSELTFVFDLPPMYSKIIDDRIPAFRWIHMIGALVIDNLAIYVGGTRVQEFPGEWIGLRATMDYPADKYLKWRSMVGDVPELHTPEWGVYGKSASYPFAKGTYPHSSNPNDTSGNEYAASIPGRRIRVPLPFWFSETFGHALPLIALQLHEVEVQITLRPLREVYRIMDSNTQADIVRPTRTLVIDPAYPTGYVDPSGTTYDNLTLQSNYQSIFNDTLTQPRYFFAPNTSTVPQTDTFFLNAHLEGNYVFVTESEQRMFASRELNYLVHQVHRFWFQSLTNRTLCDLEIFGLLTRLTFFGRRSDAIESRNDYLNFSNWKSLAQAPYWPPTPAPPASSAGLVIPEYYGVRDTIQSVRLLVMGNEVCEEKPAAYYEHQTAYANTVGGGIAGVNPGGLKPDDVMGPLYQMTFALNASDHVQPSGSINTSMRRKIQLDVTPTPLSSDAPYTYDVTAYTETMNIIKFMSGMASVQFAI